MIDKLKTLDYLISLKVHFLHNYLDFFPKNLGDVSEEKTVSSEYKRYGETIPGTVQYQLWLLLATSQRTTKGITSEKKLQKADYWVSNERKFCDFCKCWIADNKASIAFHEGGKKHKLNVSKRITEISKKSFKDERAKQKEDQQLRQMEDAAMRAYSADISRGADITSRSIAAFHGAITTTTKTAASSSSAATSNIPIVGLTYSGLVNYDVGRDEYDDDDGDDSETIKTTGVLPGPAKLPRRAIDPLLPPIDILEEDEKIKRERMQRKAAGLPLSSADVVAENSMWVEAKSDEGHTYYWNIKTNDTKWDKPKEGFMTLKEYNRINTIAEKQQEVKLHEESMFMRGNADEIVARYAREKLKERRPKPSNAEIKAKEVEQESYQIYEEPGTAAKAIGQWQTIETSKSTKTMDLQLPEINYGYVAMPIAATTSTTTSSATNSTVSAETPVKKFKEKVIESLSNEDSSIESSSFKKRKGTVKRNVRQRLDDD